MDVHDSPSSSSWKVLFSDSELDSMQEGELQHLKQHNIVEKFTSPVNETTNTESCEPVVEALAQSLDKLSLHQEQGVPETMLDISLAENPGKKDLLTEVSDRRDETDNGYQCKKKLSYNDPETKLLESRGDDLSGAAAMETDEKIEDCKRSAILHNTTNEKTSSSSLPMQNQPLHDLKENLFVDEVFENTTGTDLRLRKNDCITSTDTEQGSFKMPAIRNVDHMKSGSCNNVLGLGKRNIGTFIQGLQPSKLDLDVLTAIGPVDIDSRKYPSIAQWKKLVMSHSEATQQRSVLIRTLMVAAAILFVLLTGLQMTKYSRNPDGRLENHSSSTSKITKRAQLHLIVQIPVLNVVKQTDNGSVVLRQKEYIDCLGRNLINPHVERVHLITETSHDPLFFNSLKLREDWKLVFHHLAGA
ncbi:Ankyrin repeat and LEM [Desmophyllum pertusum]|uniref:Ankyrin repeat and LEM n=1 Tax=Desmophyllum pertusum TaxID=174260 RepID=A0A9X0D7X2_9CNID|nr:Ankyrin repeat and LEM [Desmophyllum pertusum]